MGRGHCSAKTCYVVKCETYFAHDAGSAEVGCGWGWMEIGMEMGQEQEGVTDRKLQKKSATKVSIPLMPPPPVYYTLYKTVSRSQHNPENEIF